MQQHAAKRQRLISSSAQLSYVNVAMLQLLQLLHCQCQCVCHGQDIGHIGQQQRQHFGQATVATTRTTHYQKAPHLLPPSLIICIVAAVAVDAAAIADVALVLNWHWLRLHLCRQWQQQQQQQHPRQQQQHVAKLLGCCCHFAADF